MCGGQSILSSESTPAVVFKSFTRIINFIPIDWFKYGLPKSRSLSTILCRTASRHPRPNQPPKPPSSRWRLAKHENDGYRLKSLRCEWAGNWEPQATAALQENGKVSPHNWPNTHSIPNLPDETTKSNPPGRRQDKTSPSSIKIKQQLLRCRAALQRRRRTKPDVREVRHQEQKGPVQETETGNIGAEQTEAEYQRQRQENVWVWYSVSWCHKG